MSGSGERGLRFAGYAAIFGSTDRGGDVVRAGAFERSLRRAGPVPLLWQHRSKVRVGRIEYLREDKRGLRVIARLSGGPAGRAAAALLREGKVAGLSFGYRVRKASGSAPRALEDVELVEISLVRVPMQPRARVHAVACDSPPAAARTLASHRSEGVLQQDKVRPKPGSHARMSLT